MQRRIFYMVLLTTVSSWAQQCHTMGPFYPPRSTQQFYVYCVDAYGRIVWNCWVGYSMQYSEAANAHFHSTPPAPASTVQPANGTCSGCSVSVTRQKVGRSETMTLTPYPCWNCISQSYTDWIGFSDICWVEQKPGWRHVGGDTTGHGGNQYNHWMTVNAAYGIYYAILDFRSQYPSQTSVCVNVIWLCRSAGSSTLKGTGTARTTGTTGVWRLTSTRREATCVVRREQGAFRRNLRGNS